MAAVCGKVLFLVNDPIATEALLGDAFVDHGFDVDVFSVVPAGRVDDPAWDPSFPDVGDYDVVVPLGARWPVYDEALTRTWVGTQTQLMRDAAEAGIALLGVCFGGQLLAQAFGGTVTRSPRPEIGWYDVLSDRPEIVPDGPWFQWHFDRWTVPPGAIEIARTPNASQAFVLDRAMGVQFHPEVDTALLRSWLADDRDGEAIAAGLDHHQLLCRTEDLAASTAPRIRALVSGFLTHVAAGRRPS
ncbi:type 1 glutamine amidotransferase [Mycobacterium sp. SMC-4]|uniref:type 1 glutamine amidotransferase n=1 Tax=Mycobacterium sp. SMC-4 TaxID=2857059 RepID=UPI0021B4D38F|nr:type 1 glutamine amidotransferase [Mycobacterium sp. SMC-4]UXA16213.1 type 1 glutamine amidotransferase [Mycobacterium sp. SMC-4]